MLVHEGDADGVGVVGDNGTGAANLRRPRRRIKMVRTLMVSNVTTVSILMMQNRLQKLKFQTSTDSTPPSWQAEPSRGEESVAHWVVLWGRIRLD